MNDGWKESAREEAAARLRSARVVEGVVRKFRHGILDASSNGGTLKALTREQTAIVKAFEKSSGRLAYHVLVDSSILGETTAILCVSRDEDEWEEERRDLAKGRPIAYVARTDRPERSGFERIWIEPRRGGIARLL